MLDELIERCVEEIENLSDHDVTEITAAVLFLNNQRNKVKT